MEGETANEREIAIERRYCVLQVSPEFLIELAKGNSIKRVFIEENFLPEDARIVGVGPMNPARQTHIFDASHGVVGILIQSESYENVLPGAPIPILPPPKFKLIEEGISQKSVEAKCPACGEFALVDGNGDLEPVKRCTKCDWTKKRKVR